MYHKSYDWSYSGNNINLTIVSLIDDSISVSVVVCKPKGEKMIF